MKYHNIAVEALRQRGEEVGFVPKLPHSLFAYERPDLIGKYYKFHSGEYALIQDAAFFEHPHYIFGGIALKVKDYWRFGCPEMFILEELRGG